MSFNPLVYRTDDLTKWGFGKGSDLAAVEFDNDIWNLNSRIVAIETSQAGKQIDYIASGFDPNGAPAIFVHYTDHTIDGPFDLPIAVFDPQGPWLANTSYDINDIVSFGNTTYLAVLNFTSGATFAVNDGSGHTWLVPLFAFPGIPVTTVSTSTYTLQLSDANSYIRFTNPSGCVVTIDPFASIQWVPFTEFHLRDETLESGGGVFVEALSPAVINPVLGRLNQTAGTGATLFVKNVATDSWDIGGLQALS